MIPRVRIEDFATNDAPELSTLSTMQQYRNTQGNICKFEKMLKDNHQIMSDKDSKLIMKRCYQFQNTKIEDIYKSWETRNLTSKYIKFTQMTSNFNDIVFRIDTEVKKFGDSLPLNKPRINGSVYAFVCQIPKKTDASGNPIIMQDFQNMQSTAPDDPIYPMSPGDIDANQDPNKGIFYTIVIIYDQYDTNGQIIRDPKLMFSNTLMRSWDNNRISGSSLCFVNGAGVKSGASLKAAGCGSSDGQLAGSYKATCARPTPTGTNTTNFKDYTPWTYGVLYAVNIPNYTNKHGEAAIGIKTHHPIKYSWMTNQCIVDTYPYHILAIDATDNRVYYKENIWTPWILFDSNKYISIAQAHNGDRYAIDNKNALWNIMEAGGISATSASNRRPISTITDVSYVYVNVDGTISFITNTSKFILSTRSINSQSKPEIVTTLHTYLSVSQVDDLNIRIGTDYMVYTQPQSNPAAAWTPIKLTPRVRLRQIIKTPDKSEIYLAIGENGLLYRSPKLGGYWYQVGSNNTKKISNMTIYHITPFAKDQSVIRTV